MTIFKNILVPVEPSHEEKAIHASEIAKSLMADGGEITLFHVVEEIPGYIESQIPVVLHQQSIDHATEQMAALAKSVGPNATSSVIAGHASRSILEKAAEMEADCVVIASHKPGFSDYLLGSTAARVVRYAKCNVMVLR